MAHFRVTRKKVYNIAGLVPEALPRRISGRQAGGHLAQDRYQVGCRHLGELDLDCEGVHYSGLYFREETAWLCGNVIIYVTEKLVGHNVTTTTQANDLEPKPADFSAYRDIRSTRRPYPRNWAADRAYKLFGELSAAERRQRQRAQEATTQPA